LEAKSLALAQSRFRADNAAAKPVRSPTTPPPNAIKSVCRQPSLDQIVAQLMMPGKLFAASRVEER
jgi:hypothetical protein